MTHRRTLIAFLAAVLIAPFAAGQTVDVAVDRTEILIGEQATVRLSVNYPKDRVPDVIFPQVGDTLMDKVEVVRATGIDTLNTQSDVRTRRMEKKLFITSFDSGYYAIPPFDFIVDGDTQRTEAFLLTVNTVAIDTTAGIRDIKDIYEVNVTWGDYLQLYRTYILVGLGTLLAIIVAVWLIRRYRRKRQSRPVVEPTIPERPADEVALEALDRIEQERIYARGLIKRYHTEITDVLRNYIESVTDVPAQELTSRQIMQRLRYSGLSDRETRMLREVLFRADLVKFAREVPEEDENQAALRQAREFVAATAPQWMNREKEENEPAA